MSISLASLSASRSEGEGEREGEGEGEGGIIHDYSNGGTRSPSPPCLVALTAAMILSWVAMVGIFSTTCNNAYMDGMIM